MQNISHEINPHGTDGLFIGSFFPDRPLAQRKLRLP
jgi:hypothetical protein